jgi:hypothetical protein
MEKITTAISRDIMDDSRNIEVYNAVFGALEKFIGKDVTKRVVAPVEVALGKIGSFTVYLDQSYSYMSLLCNDNAAGKKYTFTLYYNSQGKEYKPEDFEKHNACYGSAAQERIDKNMKFLRSPADLFNMSQGIDMLNQAKEILKGFSSYDIPGLYEVQNETKTKWD